MIFTELNLANNKVFECTIPLELVDKLLPESIEQFLKYTEQSEKYPETSDVYLFRTPSSLKEKNTGPGYQWTVFDTESTDEVKSFILANVTNHFGYDFRIADFWYLLQTNESWINNPTHQHMTADYVVTVYLQLNENDGIEFSDDGANTQVYYPKKGTLLVFSSTVKHRPLPNTGSNYRVSLNMELNKQSNEQETEEQKTRMEVCNTCEELSSLKMCSQCKCFMPFKTKISSAVCPLNKW